MMHRQFSILSVAVVLGVGLTAPGQVQVFPGGGVTAYDVEPRILSTGALLDAQPVVSNDRKYVTINARPANSALLALREFQFQRPLPGGFVGGANPPATPGGGFTVELNPPASVLNDPQLLNRRGMLRLSTP